MLLLLLHRQKGMRSISSKRNSSFPSPSRNLLAWNQVYRVKSLCFCRKILTYIVNCLKCFFFLLYINVWRLSHFLPTLNVDETISAILRQGSIISKVIEKALQKKVTNFSMVGTDFCRRRMFCYSGHLCPHL